MKTLIKAYLKNAKGKQGALIESVHFAWIVCEKQEMGKGKGNEPGIYR